MRRWKTGKGYILHDCKRNGEWRLRCIWLEDREDIYIKEAIQFDDRSWIDSCACKIKPPKKIRALIEAYNFFEKIKGYGDGFKV